MLEAIYGWFTEGFDTPDLQEAKALLTVLGSQVVDTSYPSLPTVGERSATSAAVHGGHGVPFTSVWGCEQDCSEGCARGGISVTA